MVTIKRYFGKIRKPLRWRGWRRFVRRVVLPVLAAALLLVATRSLLVTQLSLPADMPALGLLAGDRLIVDRTAFGVRLSLPGTQETRRVGSGCPVRGDIVVFDATGMGGGLRVGRVEALPGDTVGDRRLPAGTCHAGGVTFGHDRLVGRVACVSYSADPDMPFYNCLRRHRFFLRVGRGSDATPLANRTQP